MKTSLEFESIPWIFLHIIPTKLEVDGIKYHLNQNIDLSGISKSYGHHRLRLVFGGIIKTKPIIITAASSLHYIKFSFKYKNWHLFLIPLIASSYLVFSKPHSILLMCLLIPIFCIFQLIDGLIIFVHIQETNPPPA